MVLFCFLPCWKTSCFCSKKIQISGYWGRFLSPSLPTWSEQPVFPFHFLPLSKRNGRMLQRIPQCLVTVSTQLVKALPTAAHPLKNKIQIRSPYSEYFKIHRDGLCFPQICIVVRWMDEAIRWSAKWGNSKASALAMRWVDFGSSSRLRKVKKPLTVSFQRA